MRSWFTSSDATDCDIKGFALAKTYDSATKAVTEEFDYTNKDIVLEETSGVYKLKINRNVDYYHH